MGAPIYVWTPETETGFLNDELDALWLQINTNETDIGAHDHDADYADIGHDHDADYSALGHNHDADYVEITGDTMTGALHASAGLRVSGGFFNIGTLTVKTISGGVITATHSHHSLIAQTGSTDDLNTINGGVPGNMLILRPVSGDTITFKHGAGNILMLDGADLTVNAFRKSVTFLFHGTKWYEIAGLH